MHAKERQTEREIKKNKYHMMRDGKNASERRMNKHFYIYISTHTEIFIYTEGKKRTHDKWHRMAGHGMALHGIEREVPDNQANLRVYAYVYMRLSDDKHLLASANPI